ncbi:hypothetical protein ACA910_005646 [Epithemia clementina (nom. ined.)]
MSDKRPDQLNTSPPLAGHNDGALQAASLKQEDKTPPPSTKKDKRSFKPENLVKQYSQRSHNDRGIQLPMRLPQRNRRPPRNSPGRERNVVYDVDETAFSRLSVRDEKNRAQEYSRNNGAFPTSENSLSTSAHQQLIPRSNASCNLASFNPTQQAEKDTKTSTNLSKYETHFYPSGKHTLQIDTRYSKIKTMGSGSFGVVISATDRENPDRNVAIKMVPNIFSDSTTPIRTLREIKLLKHFGRHDNIISLIDLMPPNVDHFDDFCDVYMVTDLMKSDLGKHIRSDREINNFHARWLIYQVLCGLKYIHSCKVVHRDLKPGNLLVDARMNLKICDFGMARGMPFNSSCQEEAVTMTTYVVTRWYRAPEIILGCDYSYPIDVWSVGCIFAELMRRHPLFPEENQIQQLILINRMLGKLPECDLDFIQSDLAKRFMRSLPNTCTPPFSDFFYHAHPQILEVIHCMLQVHPRKRISVNEALEHEFFACLHNPDNEPVSSHAFDSSYESGGLSPWKVKELIWKEVTNFRPS